MQSRDEAVVCSIEIYQLKICGMGIQELEVEGRHRCLLSHLLGALGSLEEVGHGLKSESRAYLFFSWREWVEGSLNLRI